MNDLERLLARLGIGETSTKQSLSRLRPFFIPRAVWRSLAFDGSSLTFAEVQAILEALDDPREQEGRWALHVEAEEVRRRRDALAVVLESAEQGEDFSEDLIRRVQVKLQGRFLHESADEARPNAIADLIESWERRPRGENARAKPFEDAAWVLREMARRRPLGGANDSTSRLLASFLLSRAGLPPLLFGPERREAYIEALRSSGDLLVRFLAEETSAGLEELNAAEKAAFPVSAARLGMQIVERQKSLLRRLEELPTEDPAFLEARAAEVDSLAAWVDYVLARLEAASRGPFYSLHRSQARNDWVSRLLGPLYHPLYMGRATALSLRVTPHRESNPQERPIRFPATEAALTIFVAATRGSLQLVMVSPQASAIRNARRRPAGPPTARPPGLPPTPTPAPRDIAEAKLELEGAPLAADWPQADTEAWILSWVERMVVAYDEELSRLNGIE